MAKGKPSEQQLAEIRALAAEWGKIVARRVSPEAAGPLDFAALEQIAAAAAAGLTEGTLAVLVDQQARGLGAEPPCPELWPGLCGQTPRPHPHGQRGCSTPPPRTDLSLPRLSPGLFPPYAPLWGLTVTATAPPPCS